MKYYKQCQKIKTPKEKIHTGAEQTRTFIKLEVG